jgi:hypothetical protein
MQQKRGASCGRGGGGPFHPLFFVPYLAPCTKSEPCMGVLLRQRLCSCTVLFKQPWRARPRLDAMQCDAMQASVRRSASVFAGDQDGPMHNCLLSGSPEPRTSAPWLRLHPRPPARRDWSAPTALPVAGCSAGESLGAHRAGWDMEGRGRRESSEAATYVQYFTFINNNNTTHNYLPAPCQV